VKDSKIVETLKDKLDGVTGTAGDKIKSTFSNLKDTVTGASTSKDSSSDDVNSNLKKEDSPKLDTSRKPTK